jgi:5-methylcytosine-specific restriction enzyme subunit McrC
MRTDVTLRSSACTIVMDAKFYAEPFQRSVGVPKFRSAHLYQLFAYMKHASDRAEGLPVMGALVYAAPAGPSLNRYRMDGHEIAIATIDLSQPWTTVHHDLLEILRSLQPEFDAVADPARSGAAVLAHH